MKNILLTSTVLLLVFSPAPWAFSLASTSQPPRSIGSPSADKHEILPLHREGDAMFVDVELNGRVKSRFLLDTGATHTIISTELARKLSLNLKNSGLVPIRSASGMFLVRLGKVKSLAAGEVTIRNLEIFVSDTGFSGILGMSFLENFDFTINLGQKQLVLAERGEVAGQKTFGGYPEAWWRRKFTSYRSLIESIKAHLPTARQLNNEELELGFSRSLQHYEGLLKALDKKASSAGVPRRWRK